MRYRAVPPKTVEHFFWRDAVKSEERAAMAWVLEACAGDADGVVAARPRSAAGAPRAPPRRSFAIGKGHEGYNRSDGVAKVLLAGPLEPENRRSVARTHFAAPGPCLPSPAVSPNLGPPRAPVSRRRHLPGPSCGLPAPEVTVADAASEPGPPCVEVGVGAPEVPALPATPAAGMRAGGRVAWSRRAPGPTAAQVRQQMAAVSPDAPAGAGPVCV